MSNIGYTNGAEGTVIDANLHRSMFGIGRLKFHTGRASPDPVPYILGHVPPIKVPYMLGHVPPIKVIRQGSRPRCIPTGESGYTFRR